MKNGLIPVNLGDEDDIDSVVNTIEKLKGCIHQLMDQGTIQIEHHNKYEKGKDVAIVEIPYDAVNVQIPITLLVIEFPAPFSYEDEKVVPWIYQPKAFKKG